MAGGNNEIQRNLNHRFELIAENAELKKRVITLEGHLREIKRKLVKIRSGDA